MLNVIFYYCYAECRYAERRYAECHGAVTFSQSKKKIIVQITIQMAYLSSILMYRYLFNLF
jgi:hypothetical protein